MNGTTFAILGAGRMGRALGRLLAQHGLKPGAVSSTTIRSARQAAAFIGGGEPVNSNLAD